LRTDAVRKIIEADLVQDGRESNRSFLHKSEKAWQGLHQKQTQASDQRDTGSIAAGATTKPDDGIHRKRQTSKPGAWSDTVRDTFLDVASALRFIFSFPFILIILFYRYLISPGLPRSCNFTPTCSQYSLEAVTKYGIIKGGWLSAKRIWRCRGGNPGGYDPVP